MPQTREQPAPTPEARLRARILQVLAQLGVRAAALVHDGQGNKAVALLKAVEPLTQAAKFIYSADDAGWTPFSADEIAASDPGHPCD